VHASGDVGRALAGSHSGWSGYEATAIIHPGLVIPPVILQFDIQHDNNRQTCIRFGSDGGFDRIANTSGLTIELGVGCEDLSGREIKIELSNVELEDIADHFMRGSHRVLSARL
jgi:hypothetical protein